VPAAPAVTFCEPLLATLPLQAPDAVQPLAGGLLTLQVSVMTWPVVVAVGVALFTLYAVRTGRGRYDAAHHPQLELTVLYWHLVELVWVFLFPLLYLVDRA